MLGGGYSTVMGVVLALRALGRNRGRSSLTIAGLLIGVAAVVMVAGLSSGASAFLGKKLQSMGTNLLIVAPRTTEASGVHRDSGSTLTEGDAQAIGAEVSSVGGVTPIIFGQSKASVGERNVSTRVYGAQSSVFAIRDWPFARGDVWTPTDELTKAKVCVLGTTVARKLFDDENPVGRTIRIGRHLYVVIGVLTSKGQDLFGINDQDDRIWMPIGSARTRVLHRSPGAADFLMASASSVRSADRAMTQIDELLRQRHRTKGHEADFIVDSQVRLLEIQQVTFDALTAFLACVASVSLLVGGIGVMNIMLVSVTERTREIGIRRAIGASRANIRTQFLIESAILALIGGLAGAVVGVAGLAGFEAVLHWPMRLSVEALAAGITVSALTGVVFGLAPARKAALLDPIEALRHE